MNECDLECQIDKNKTKLTKDQQKTCIVENGVLKCDFASYLKKYITKYASWEIKAFMFNLLTYPFIEFSVQKGEKE